MGKSRLKRLSEVRKQLADGQVSPAERLRGLLGWSLVIALGFFLVATVLVLSGDERFPYALNDRLDQPVFARVGFERVNASRTAKLRETAQQLVPDHYRLNQALVDRIKGEFLDLHAAVKAVETFEQFQKNSTGRWDLEPAGFESLKPLTNQAGSVQFKRTVDAAVQRLIRSNMIERPQTERGIPNTAAEVKLDRGNGRFTSIDKVRLIYATNSEHVSALAERLVAAGFPQAVRPLLAKIIEKAVVAGSAGDHSQPVYVFDREFTRARIEEAGLAEPVKDTYKPGDRLVQAGVIDGNRLSLLKAEHSEFVRQRHTDPLLWKALWRKRLGLAGAILLLTAGLALFAWREQPRIVRNPTRALAFALLLLAMLLLTRFMVGVGSSVMWSVGAITIAGAVLTITYSQRFAIGATTLLALLSVLALDAPISLFLVLLTVTCVNVLLLSEIRTRLKLVEVGALTATAAGASAMLVGLIHQQQLGKSVLVAICAAMAGTIVIFVLLPVIERAFGIATSLTLLEWADTSNPLLRQVIQKAPGTWQHSHLLGSMAESAAEVIGANGLLVRVGAYYHDVGKICKPNYFVENQQANRNVHDGLAPTMSLLVILAHVKDGLALAREYGLPPVLHQFIAEHHGTTVVKYFHARATQDAKPTGKHDRQVSETEFRYPGPKPRTRESVILMMCDGVEGAVRALQDPTAGRIESTVHEIMTARLMDGQVDNCDITLKELARVEQSLVKNLCAIHHGRIAYPTAAEEKSPVLVARSA